MEIQFDDEPLGVLQFVTDLIETFYIPTKVWPNCSAGVSWCVRVYDMDFGWELWSDRRRHHMRPVEMAGGILIIQVFVLDFRRERLGSIDTKMEAANATVCACRIR